MAFRTGVQLYIFKREYLIENLEQILKTISSLGYAGVEGLPGHYEDYREILDRYELEYYGPHICAGDLDGTDGILNYCIKMGASEIVSSGPIVWDNRTEDDYRETCDLLNHEGERLRKEGINLHYHNHDFEFKKAAEGGGMAFDIILENLDPGCCDLCFDTGWAVLADADPVEFMNSNKERISMIHLRDFQDRTSCPLGGGEHDVPAVVKAAMGLPSLRRLVIEQDPNPDTPLDDIETSIKYLSTLF